MKRRKTRVPIYCFQFYFICSSIHFKFRKNQRSLKFMEEIIFGEKIELEVYENQRAKKVEGSNRWNYKFNKTEDKRIDELLKIESKKKQTSFQEKTCEKWVKVHLQRNSRIINKIEYEVEVMLHAVRREKPSR